jgi:type II secretory pathway component GspD/PulD (secretin)
MNRGLGIIFCVIAALGCVSADLAADDAGAGMPRSAGVKLITIQTAKTEIVDALRLVAEQGGMNLVIGPEVTGPVSLYLENVPVETALRAIAVNNGFSYTVEDGLITVSKPAGATADGKPAGPPLATRIFTLQCQDAERIREVLEFALTPAGKIKVLNENSSPGYGMTRLTDLGGDLGTNSGYSTGYSNNTSNRVSPSRPSSDVNLNLPTAAGPADSSSGGDLPRNARTLVATDTEENLARIAELIADLDRLPPQVLIEARIVEMTTDLQRQLGIDWDVNVLANGPVLNHTLPLEWRAGFAPGSQIRYAPDGTPRSANGMSLGTIDFSRFTALVRVHATDNSIRLLANPRLLVFNNHSASILVGERYPLLQANITDQGTLTEALDTYVPVGIQLEVTPTVMTDGRVSLMVHPMTSALGDEVVGTTGLRVRRILTREIDTRIVMHDGQTVVLGGLISDRKSRTVNKIPGLGDLPVMDVFFRQESPASQRVDLLVFLTARIEGATEISERDRIVYDMYRPQFKQIERLQDAQLHFEIPTEYQPPKAQFGDPPNDEVDESEGPDAVSRQAPPEGEQIGEMRTIASEQTREVEPEPVREPEPLMSMPETASPHADQGGPAPEIEAGEVPGEKTTGSPKPASAGRFKTLKTQVKDAVESVRRRLGGDAPTQDKTAATPMVESHEVP